MNTIRISRYLSVAFFFIFVLWIIFSSKPDRILKTEAEPEYHHQYYLLQDYLKEYELIQKNGGWKTIPSGDTLKTGTRNNRVSLLHERLSITKELDKNTISIIDSFDLSTEKAVKFFQKRHNLMADGIVEKNTLAALNISIEQRIKQIKINLNRWKQMPAVMEDYYIFVNTADFSLELVENDSLVLEMKVIVGRNYRKTPVIHSSVTGIIFNPYWYIPPGILKNDILPKIKKDSSFVKRMRMRIYETSPGNKSKKEINPDQINWKEINSADFPYQIVQSPGLNNPMGAMKFSIPNNYLVYLHDTPDKELFEKKKRTFSSGCIRISKAKDLADYILKDMPDVNTDSIIKSKKTVTVTLATPVKIYIEYFTCWVDENGTINFREDIYGRDN